MSERYTDSSKVSAEIPNGSAAAAILASGIGIAAFAVTALAGDKSAAIKNRLNLYRPTGPLSGVAAVGVVLWILCWILLEWRWSKKTVSAKSVGVASLVLLALGLLLTFPPFVDFL